MIIASLIYTLIVLVIALADMRLWFYRLSKKTRLIDDMIVNLDNRVGVIEVDCNARDGTNLFIEEYKDFMINYKKFLGRGGETLNEIKKRASLKKSTRFTHSERSNAFLNSCKDINSEKSRGGDLFNERTDLNRYKRSRSSFFFYNSRPGLTTFPLTKQQKVAQIGSSA